MDEMTIGDILKDFRSIKLSGEKRAFVDSARAELERTGSLPVSTRAEIRRMVMHYKSQFDELHAARERARKTNWRRREGLSSAQVSDLVWRRREQREAQKNDVGF